MHKQRLAIIIASVIGILSVFMPWANVPIRGSINAMEQFGDAGSFGVKIILLFAVPIVLAFLGDRTKPMWMWSGQNIKKGIKIWLYIMVWPIPFLLFRTNPFLIIASLANALMIALIPMFIEASMRVGNTNLAVKYSLSFGFGVAIIVAICLFLLSFEGVAKKLFGNDGFNA